MKEAKFLILMIIILALALVVVKAENNKMVVEANVLSSGNESGGREVSIEIPNYIFFGDIRKGEKSNDTKVFINNTGNVDLVVTPQLKNSSEVIFKNLYFQTRKQSQVNPELNVIYPIGNYKLNLTANKKNEYFYMWLDLRDYEDPINENMIGHKADVIFTAMAQ